MNELNCCFDVLDVQYSEPLLSPKNRTKMVLLVQWQIDENTTSMYLVLSLYVGTIFYTYTVRMIFSEDDLLRDE